MGASKVASQCHSVMPGVWASVLQPIAAAAILPVTQTKVTEEKCLDGNKCKPEFVCFQLQLTHDALALLLNLSWLSGCMPFQRTLHIGMHSGVH